MQVLTWTVHTTRPLELRDLQCALSIEPESSDLDLDALPDEISLISACMSLVVIDQSSVIRLVHYTAQEYFQSRRTDLFPDGHAQIAKTCMTLLSLCGTGSTHPHSSSYGIASFYTQPSYVERDFSHSYDHTPSTSYPLLLYAVQECGLHISKAPEAKLQFEIFTFLDKSNTAIYDIPYSRSTSKYVSIPVHKVRLEPSGPKDLVLNGKTVQDILIRQIGPLGILTAIMWNLKETMATFLRQGRNVSTEIFFEQSALQWALFQGHHAMVELFIDHGADVLFRDYEARSTLHAAVLSRTNDAEEVKAMLELLLEKSPKPEININTQDSDGNTPLHIASMRKVPGFEETLKWKIFGDDHG